MKSHPKPHNPLVELRAFVAHWLDEARRLPGCAYVFDLLGLQQIGTEAAAHANACAASAYEAERFDRAAARLIRDALSDGKVTPREIPAMRRAERLAARAFAASSVASTLLIVGAMFLLAGCASVAGRGFPRVQLDHQHVESEADGWAAARQWLQGSPARGAVSAGHCCGSMLPHIRPGQILLLLPIDGTPLQPGAVAIFRNADGSTTVHAVAEDNGRAVLFFGTNNRHSDGWISRERVLWRVVSVVTWPGVAQP